MTRRPSGSLVLTAALVLALTTGTVSAPAGASTPVTDSTIEVLSPAEDATILTTTEVRVHVVSAEAGRVSVYPAMDPSTPVPIAAGQCSAGCDLTFRYRPGVQAAAYPAPVRKYLGAFFVAESGALVRDDIEVDYRPLPAFDLGEIRLARPEDELLPQFTRLIRPETIVYGPLLSGREMDSVLLEVTGTPAGGADPVTRSETVRVGADGRARFTLDPAVFAEGTVWLRARPAHDGNIGVSSTKLFTVGVPVLTAATPPRTTLYEGHTPDVLVLGVRGAFNHWATPVEVATRVDGGPETRQPVRLERPVGGSAGYTEGLVGLPREARTPGRHSAVVRLVLSDGTTLAPVTTSWTVEGFAASVQAPVLVVGRPATASATVTPPKGLTLSSCGIGLRSEGTWVTAVPCPTGSSSVTGPVTVTPTVAGATSWGVALQGTSPQDLVNHTGTVPVTVHPRVGVSVRAPDAVHGTKTSLVLTATRQTRTTQGFTPQPSAVLTLQRRDAGATAWTTVGTYRAGTAGTVSVPFTASRNYEWRASTTTAYGTVWSSVDRSGARTSIGWSKVTSTVARDASFSFVATVRPADSGATAVLETRKSGSTAAWTTRATGTVSRTGEVRLSGKLTSRGDYEVRVRTRVTARLDGNTSSARSLAVR